MRLSLYKLSEIARIVISCTGYFVDFSKYKNFEAFFSPNRYSIDFSASTGLILSSDLSVILLTINANIVVIIAAYT